MSFVLCLLPCASVIKPVVVSVQEEAVALLCGMADFPFYRPAIRKAEPAAAVAVMLQAGSSQVGPSSSTKP